MENLLLILVSITSIVFTIGAFFYVKKASFVETKKFCYSASFFFGNIFIANYWLIDFYGWILVSIWSVIQVVIFWCFYSAHNKYIEHLRAEKLLEV